MMSTFKKILILISVLSTVDLQNFGTYVPLENYNSCVAIENGVLVNGFCAPIVNCPSILAKFLANIFDYTVCRIDGTIQIVCCTTTQSMIEPYHIPNTLDHISSGTDVEYGEYSHMAALGYMLNDKIGWICGGSLISNQYVLTAAHCLTDHDTGPVQIVRLGTVDLRDANDISYWNYNHNFYYYTNSAEDFEVAKLLPHPNYTRKYYYNDIGLIELSRKVTFSFLIRPICLPSNFNRANGFQSMGWGKMGPFDVSSLKLLKVDQELYSHEDCQSFYNVGRKFPNGIMQDTQICAGSRTSTQSTCRGDSGGPLLSEWFQNGQKIHVIDGIVSFGTPCGFINNPGVYTKVYPYVEWILKNI